ncbi:MAG TPA: phenylalanine--tRNA ligase subunit beta, partial [Burkholderiaceae bacterium]|nr:phenylalanine--tRNA ligase subunit beta [Burkholderiaceae bacterium]
AEDGALSVAGFHQPKRMAALAYGPVVEEQWGQAARNVDFFDLKADLEALFAPRGLRFVKNTHPALHPGRCAAVELDGRIVGVIGELHPRLQQKYDLPLAPVLFEVEAPALAQREVPAYAEISRFPAVTRDLALVVKQFVTAQEVIDTLNAEKHANPICGSMQAIVLFDEYRGKGLESDEKSLAFRFTMQDTQRTLQDEHVDAAMAAFVAAVQKKHGAKLRT